MLGVLITLVFSLGAACFGYAILRHFLREQDVALRIGVSGLVGLATIGLLTLVIGLFPGGLKSLGLIMVWLIVAAAGLYRAYKQPPTNWAKPNIPKGVELLFPVALGLALMFSLVGALAPADTLEWDSLAYHLAVPKLWLSAGQIQPISFIHHSNFPFSIDNLYIWGLSWGGESGAKAFTLAFHTFGLLAIFGAARQRYGQLSAWWAGLVWATVPVVLWLSGTAYIDVQNGLFAGLGIIFAAEFLRSKDKDNLWLAAVMLGFAAGSKYTGLQTIFAACLVVFIVNLKQKGPQTNPNQTQLTRTNPSKAFKHALALAGVAMAIAAPWYIKNALWVHNPVYPFFFKQLGGKNWSLYNSEIYQNEQQTFGAARPTENSGNPNYTAGPIQVQRIGQAILGLAYQPGRYINPSPTQNQGVLPGAIGAVVIAALLLWPISGRMKTFERATVAMVAISLLMWFVLSEQSRYIIALAVPLSILAGGAIVRLKIGPVLAGLAVVQALYSFYLLKTTRFDTQVPLAVGKVSRDEYLTKSVGFYAPAKYLNEAAKGGRVALYDEVFGYLLDVPYFWANPGHSTEMGYNRMSNAADLIAGLKREGITHVYLNLSIYSPEDRAVQTWIAAMGLQSTPVPYPPDQREALMKDMGWRWKVLLAEAIAEGRLSIDRAFGRRLVLRVN